MSDKSNNSVAVDHETWEILTNWAEEECRSISGQIKFLVRTYGPSDKLSEKDQYKLYGDRTAAQKTLLAQIKDPSCSEQPPLPFTPTTESSWIQHKCITKYLRTTKTVRNQLLDTCIEWGGPLTNSELWALLPSSLNLSLKKVIKQSGGMFGHGYLKRRKSLSHGKDDRYQFEITSAGRKLVKERDIKRQKLRVVA